MKYLYELIASPGVIDTNAEYRKDEIKNDEVLSKYTYIEIVRDKVQGAVLLFRKVRNNKSICRGYRYFLLENVSEEDIIFHTLLQTDSWHVVPDEYCADILNDGETIIKFDEIKEIGCSRT